MEIKTIDELNKTLNKIPGVSKKQADRISNFLLNQPREFSDEIISKINDLKNNITFCPKCCFIVENGKCLNCDRDNVWNILMVVESVQNAKKIFDMNFYDGYFYILPYLLDIDKKDDYNYPNLIKFAKEKKVDEVVLVLSLTLEGSMTNEHLSKLLKENNFKVSRAAIGLPMGANIEYLDSYTIKQSIENRTK